jgi:hypothetical protein
MVNKKDFTGGKARGEVRWKCSVSQAVFTRVMHFQSIFLSFSFPSPFSDTEKMKNIRKGSTKCASPPDRDST